MVSTTTVSSSAAALQLLQEFQQVQSHRAELYAKLSAGFREFLDHGQEVVFARLMQELTPAFNEVSKQVIHIEACLKSAAVDRAELAGLLRQIQEMERNKLRLTLSWQALRAAHAAGQFSWQAEADRPTIRPKPSHEQQHQQQMQAMLQQMQLEQAHVAGGIGAAAGFNGNGNLHSSNQHHQYRQQGSGQVDGFMSVKPGFYEQQLQQATTAAAAAAQLQQSQTSDLGYCAGLDAAVEQTNQYGHQHHGCCGHVGHDHSPGEGDPLEPDGSEPSEVEYTAAVKEALQELDACVLAINEVLEEVKYAVQDLQEEVA